MRHERLSLTLSKETCLYFLIVCLLSLPVFSQTALAQSGRRPVKKESPPPVSVDANAESEKAKDDKPKVETRRRFQISDWQTLAPAGEEFSIVMPPLSDIYQGTTYVDLGNHMGQRVTVRIYRSLTDEALFVIQSYDAENLKEVEEDVIKFNRQLSFGSDLKLNGFKGKSFTRKVFSLFGKGQYFITKEHLYIVEVARRGGDDPSIDTFLGSLSFGAPRQPTKLKVVPLPQSDTILNSRQVTRQATILWKPTPTYVPQAGRRGERGRVILKALLASNGRVTDIEVSSGLRYGLNEQAIEAAKWIIFVPPEKDGEYVSQRVQIEYDFNIY